jgi:hypothetical protein
LTGVRALQAPGSVQVFDEEPEAQGGEEQTSEECYTYGHGGLPNGWHRIDAIRYKTKVLFFIGIGRFFYSIGIICSFLILMDLD